MTGYINAISIGIKIFPFFAGILTIWMTIQMIQQKGQWNLKKAGVNYVMLLYGVCVIALVIFPLPSTQRAATLQGHQIQPIPFRFVLDSINEFFKEKRLYNKALLHMSLNMMMMVPSGIFLRYYFKVSMKKAIGIGAAISILIEVTQLTGIFGIYAGSYRLCDMDDVIANTFGTYLGYLMIQKVEHILPSLESTSISRLEVLFTEKRKAI